MVSGLQEEGTFYMSLLDSSMPSQVNPVGKKAEPTEKQLILLQPESILHGAGDML